MAYNRKHWDEKEELIIRKIYPRWGAPGVTEQLPNRSKKSIRRKAYRMNVIACQSNRGNTFDEDAIKNISEIKKAYFAGFFDGEGCVYIKVDYPTKKNKQKSPSYGLQFVISNTNKQVMDEFYKTFGGFITSRMQSYKGSIPRRIYIVRAYSRRARLILETMLPYLIVKRKEAILSIKFQDGIHYGPKKLTKDMIKTRAQFAKQIAQLKKVSQ